MSGNGLYPYWFSDYAVGSVPGPIGPTGPTGVNTPGQSVTGPTGPQGPVDSKGFVGPTGPTGQIGFTGPSAGPVGPTGPQGPVGGLIPSAPGAYYNANQIFWDSTNQGGNWQNIAQITVTPAVVKNQYLIVNLLMSELIASNGSDNDNWAFNIALSGNDVVNQHNRWKAIYNSQYSATVGRGAQCTTIQFILVGGNGGDYSANTTSLNLWVQPIANNTQLRIGASYFEYFGYNCI